VTAVLSPDCAAGKCGACPGDGWDADRDWTAPCPCLCHRTPLAHDRGTCPVCDGAGLTQSRNLVSAPVVTCMWVLGYCPACNGQGTYPPQPLAVLAAQEAELHDGDCCDPGDAA